MIKRKSHTFRIDIDEAKVYDLRMSKDQNSDDACAAVTVGVRMTVDEREAIRLAARRLGVGLSTFLRMKALEASRE